MKTALEKYWSGKISQAELIDVSHTAQAIDWQLQADAGITRVGIDGTLYDQLLDTTYLLGLAPTRFKDFSGLDLYFAMARGAGGVNAMDLSKFFDTNYHYIVSAVRILFGLLSYASLFGFLSCHWLWSTCTCVPD
jgi:5-methyltetrahydropteroyltriglutamate--homocysteine methyltransferase